MLGPESERHGNTQAAAKFASRQSCSPGRVDSRGFRWAAWSLKRDPGSVRSRARASFVQPVDAKFASSREKAVDWTIDFGDPEPARRGGHRVAAISTRCAGLRGPCRRSLFGDPALRQASLPLTVRFCLFAASLHCRIRRWVSASHFFGDARSSGRGRKIRSVKVPWPAARSFRSRGALEPALCIDRRQAFCRWINARICNCPKGPTCLSAALERGSSTVASFGVPVERKTSTCWSRCGPLRLHSLILTRHEQAAGVSWRANHGPLTGRPGVCLATLGPGGAFNFSTRRGFCPSRAPCG